MGSERTEGLFLYFVHLLDPATCEDTELQCDVRIPMHAAAGRVHVDGAGLVSHSRPRASHLICEMGIIMFLFLSENCKVKCIKNYKTE